MENECSSAIPLSVCETANSSQHGVPLLEQQCSTTNHEHTNYGDLIEERYSTTNHQEGSNCTKMSVMSDDPSISYESSDSSKIASSMISPEEKGMVQLNVSSDCISNCNTYSGVIKISKHTPIDDSTDTHTYDSDELNSSHSDSMNGNGSMEMFGLNETMGDNDYQHESQYTSKAPQSSSVLASTCEAAVIENSEAINSTKGMV